MKKSLTAVFAAVLIMLVCAWTVFATEPADSVFLPMDWVEKRQTDSFVSSKLEAFADEGIVNIYVTVASYLVEETASGVPQVNSSVSLTSLAKWIRAADARGMNIYASVHIEAGELLFAEHGNQIPGEQIKKQAVFLAQKLLVDGISYNGTAYTLDGMLLSGCDFSDDYAEYYSGILENWNSLDSEGSVSCTLTDLGADFAEAAADCVDAVLITVDSLPEEPSELEERFKSIMVLLRAEDVPDAWLKAVEAGAEQVGVTIK